MTATQPRVERHARLRWIPIADMRVSPLAQRDLNQARVDKIAANFDVEQVGTPTVNQREGVYYVIDGQHRIEALREMGWSDQQIQCWVYVGLTEQEEAEKFLKLNDVLAVNAYYRFKVGVQAGRLVESDVDRIVRSLDLRVSLDSGNGSIRAVGTLVRIYNRAGAKALQRTLRIVRDAYGDAGLEAAVLDGIGLLCQRYEAELNDERAVDQLANAHGGVNGLLGKAENLRRQTGNPKAHCVAAAATEIINRKGGKRLPAWWRDNDGPPALKTVS